MPLPDPQLEKNKLLFTYDPTQHDYSEDKPEMVDIGHEHYVYGNKKEIEEYKKIRESDVPMKSITILGPNDPRPERTAIDESLDMAEILETPIHDTGSIWYTVLGFFLPIIGLILWGIFNHFHFRRSARRVKAGTIAGFIVLGLILVIFILALIFASL